MRQGIMALEGLNEPQEEIRAEVTDFVDAPENDLAEADAAQGEADAVNDDIDEAVDTAGTLDTIAEKMGDSLEEGGLSEPEAEALEVAVEHLCARVGFPRNRKVFPAMEGFSAKESRIQATKIAMESVMEKAKKIWDSIIAALKKVWEHIKNFFIGLYDGAKKLQRRAVALQKSAEANKNAATGAKVSTGSFGKTLLAGRPISSNENVAGHLLEAYNKHTSSGFITEDRSKLATDVGGIIEKMYKEATPETAAAAAKEAQEMIAATTGGKETTSSGQQAPEGVKVFERPLEFGDQSFFAFVGMNGTSNVYSVKIAPSANAATGDGPKEVPAASPADAAKIAGAVAKHLEMYKGSPSNVGEAMNKLTSLVGKLKNVKSDNESSAKIAATLVRNASTAITQTGALLKGYDVKVAKALLDYVGASLGATNKAAASAANAPETPEPEKK